MARRSIWKGNLRFSLVSIPVEVYSATEPEQDIRLNQLHDECHSRIRYKKVCPIHGDVGNDEIVTGYEYEKDHYVVVDRSEVEEQLHPERAIAIETFVAPGEIDSMYFDGQGYYLAPANGSAAQPYAVMRDAMKKLNRWAVATGSLHGRERLMLIRPVDDLLAMIRLRYQSQIRDPSFLRDEAPKRQTSAQELKLAQQLITASTDKKFDLKKFHDYYTVQLREAIEAKVEGKDVVVPEQAEEEVPVINLMDALKRSVQSTKRGPKSPKKPAYRHVQSGRTRRRKSS